MYFSQLGHDVMIVDNLAKQQWEAEVDGAPLEHIPTLRHRVRVWNDVKGKEIAVAIGDITENHRFVYRVFEEFAPDAVVHYARAPPPYSMIGHDQVYTRSATTSRHPERAARLSGSHPKAHLELGTMGEYGTPNIDIEEGFIAIEHTGRSDPFRSQMPGRSTT